MNEGLFVIIIIVIIIYYAYNSEQFNYDMLLLNKLCYNLIN